VVSTTYKPTKGEKTIENRDESVSILPYFSISYILKT